MHVPRQESEGEVTQGDFAVEQKIRFVSVDVRRVPAELVCIRLYHPLEELVEPYGQSRWRRTNAQAGRHAGHRPLLPAARIEGLFPLCPKLLNVTRYHHRRCYPSNTISFGLNLKQRVLLNRLRAISSDF